MSVRTLIGDCREVLRSLPDESVHCVVTSPPYFGLRDYGTAKWEGGDPGCSHEGSDRYYTEKTAAVSSSDAFIEAGPANAARLKKGRWREGGKCIKCGAHHSDGQLGLEATPESYVAELVAVFREVRRVLRKDGTCWVNLGDSYASTGARSNNNGTGKSGLKADGRDEQSRLRSCAKTKTIGMSSLPAIDHSLKPKDLIGIPWMVAFALRAAGWWLRQDIIWSKSNPMPESVTDRCTKAHEYIFMLTKAERYYFDAAAIAEDAIRAGDWNNATEQASEYAMNRLYQVGATRNKRSVWHVATQPYSEAHFATFPPALIEPCILAGCPAKCCAKCGAPWEREVEKGELRPVRGNYLGELAADRKIDGTAEIIYKAGRSMVRTDEGWSLLKRDVRTVGFSPSCTCDAGTVPGTCLDPFGGAGTTGLVADRLQRNAILIELNPAYAEMGERRVYDDAPLLAFAGEIVRT